MNDRAESRITPRHRAWGEGVIVELLTMMDTSGMLLVLVGGKRTISVLERFNLR